MTLTVAQAFKVALDLWEIAQEGESVVKIQEGTKGDLYASVGPLKFPLCCGIRMLCLSLRLSEPEDLIGGC